MTTNLQAADFAAIAMAWFGCWLAGYIPGKVLREFYRLSEKL